MMGTMLGPVPLITYLGSILALIGAIIVILGRKAFGPSHSRNAIWSIIIYVVGIAVVIVGAFVFVISVITAAVSTNTGTGPSITTLSQALTSAFNNLLITVVLGAVIFGIAQVLFTYAIQNLNGRIVLWAAYASSIAISIIEAIISQLLSNAVQESIIGGTFNPAPLGNLQSQLQALGLLGLIPAALFSSALYTVWSRITHGEIPAPATQTVM